MSDKSSKLDENVLVQTAEHSDPIINRGGHHNHDTSQEI